MKTNSISNNENKQKAPPFFQSQTARSNMFFLKTKFTPSSYLFKPESQNKSIPNIILNNFPANQNSGDKKQNLLKSPTNAFSELTKKYPQNAKAINFEKLTEHLPKDTFLKKTSLSKTPKASQLKKIFNEKSKKPQQNDDSSNLM